MASRSFRKYLKDFIKASQPTVSNTLQAFSDCVTKKVKHFIYMPRNRGEEEAIKSEFYGIAGFPGVPVCIHGTHIPIIAPSREECSYINRKNFNSVNMQVGCNPPIIFDGVVAKWPGSHHDSFILQSSALYQKFENNSFDDAWVLGESGFPLKKWLTTFSLTLFLLNKNIALFIKKPAQ